jgi:hypothetical protein
VHLEHADERGACAVKAPAHRVGRDTDRDEILAVQDRARVVLVDGAAARHPFADLGNHFHPRRTFSHTASAFCAAGPDVTMRLGHGLVNPSDGHLRVASMPILLP